MKISVVVPALNERLTLPNLISSLRECDVAEIIVADGGSVDGTKDWCAAQPDIRLVQSAMGKGPQLNAGAALATGDVLLFLHADCFISQDAFHAMQSTIENSKVAAGAFCIRFAEARPRSLRMVERGINLRTRLTRTATGDQGIFVRRSIFERVGGAPDWPLFEDVELVRRARTMGKFAVIGMPLTISGRRYIEHGVFRTAFLIFLLRFGYWMGVSPQRLKTWFRDVRTQQSRS
jgi:uncharacterized protein